MVLRLAILTLAAALPVAVQGAPPATQPDAAPASQPRAPSSAANAVAPSSHPTQARHVVRRSSTSRAFTLVAARAGAVVRTSATHTIAGPATDLEVARVWPMRHWQLGLFAGLGYACPMARGTGVDDDISPNGGAFSWFVALHTLHISLGLHAWLTGLSHRFWPYLGGGLRVHLLAAATSSGSAGSSGFGTNTGIAPAAPTPLLRAGAAWRIGQGALTVELQVDRLSVDTRPTGESRTAGVYLLAGYAFIR
jgi:hypothetical protein